MSGGFQEEFSREQCFQQESFQEVFFSMSACVQDVMRADMSACALGTCVGTEQGTTHPEMLSQLKGLTSSLLSRQGIEVGTAVPVPGTAPMSGEASASFYQNNPGTKSRDGEDP